MLNRIVSRPVSLAIKPLAQGAFRLAITPNQVTVAGMILSLGAGVLLWWGWWFVAGLVIILAGLLDMLDGALARNFGLGTKFGAFLDSTCDRISDAAIYLGIAFYYARTEPDLIWQLVCIIALLGAFLTSYTRARAECLIPRCDVGIAERPERIVLILIGLLFSVMKPVIVILAVLSTITVLQRVLHTFGELRYGK